MLKTVDALKRFILDRRAMRMVHLYKPLMIQAVIKHGGTATREQIAAEFMARDTLQRAHYARRVVHEMPGKRLVRDGVLERDGDSYLLSEPFRNLPMSEQLEVMAACEKRIEDFVDRYGNPFLGNESADIPPGARYDVLTRAGGRCELCGVSHQEVPLEVDHILPRSKGGSNDPSNLQALCTTCNRDKRNADDTDFAAVRRSYDVREKGCVFCNAEVSERMVNENELAFAILDGFPVTSGHTLVIPKRHSPDFFGLYGAERQAVDLILRQRRSALLADDVAITGFNVGVNVGASAGQTVFHVHVHLIPRRDGDVGDPRGGVRGVIPERQSY